MGRGHYNNVTRSWGEVDYNPSVEEVTTDRLKLAREPQVGVQPEGD